MSKNRKGQNNTVLWVLICILLLCFAALGYGFYKFFYAGTSATKYGDRLDGIEKYPLSDSLESDIKSVYTSDKNIGEVKVTVEGRIVYINIDFVKSLKIAAAQDTAIKSLEKVGESNLTFYDVQYILTYSGEEENENFPVFGAKSASSLKVVW